MATGNKTRRIRRELQDIQADTVSQIKAEMISDNLTHLKGSFPGPPGTSYEGGHYEVDVSIPNEYPFKPPVMRFLTKIWHPNISSQTGAICLDTLSTGWSPVLTIKSALISLQSLLSSPEPKDPQDAVVAHQMISNPKEFERVAREWAVKFAGAPKTYPTESSGGAAAQSASAAKEEPLPPPPPAVNYDGYSRDMIDRFVSMGFDVNRVVEAFNYAGIPRNNGEDFDLEDAYMEEVTARLLGEQT